MHELFKVSDRQYRLSVAGDFFASPWSRIKHGATLVVGDELHLLAVDLRVTRAEHPKEITLQLTGSEDIRRVTSDGGRPALFEPLRRWLPDKMETSTESVAK